MKTGEMSELDFNDLINSSTFEYTFLQQFS